MNAAAMFAEARRIAAVNAAHRDDMFAAGAAAMIDDELARRGEPYDDDQDDGPADDDDVPLDLARDPEGGDSDADRDAAGALLLALLDAQAEGDDDAAEELMSLLDGGPGGGTADLSRAFDLADDPAFDREDEDFPGAAVLAALDFLAEGDGDSFDAVVKMLKGEDDALDLSRERAPAGGVTIRGKSYRGGQFIPSEERAKAAEAVRSTVKKVKDAGYVTHEHAAHLLDNVAALGVADLKELRKELGATFGKSAKNKEAMAAKIREHVTAAKLPEDVPEEAPEPEAAAGAAAVKPWEMTRGEFAHWSREQETGQKPFVGENADELNADVVRLRGGDHRHLVKAAMERGEPVPPEVLADYPDLAPPAAEQNQDSPSTGVDKPTQMDNNTSAGPDGSAPDTTGGGEMTDERQISVPKSKQKIQTAKNGKSFIEITPNGWFDREVSAAGEVEVGGRRYKVTGYGEEYRTSDGFKRRAYLERAKEPGEITIAKTSSMRSVDDYRPGEMIRHEGEWYKVVGYSRSGDDRGSYEHRMALRPATAEEKKSARAGEIRAEMRAMSAGPSDDRDRPAHDAEYARLDDELRATEGRPSRADEAAEAARPKTADTGVRRRGAAALAVPAADRGEDDWAAIAAALNDISLVSHGRSRGFHAGEVSRWTDDEIREWFDGEDMGGGNA